MSNSENYLIIHGCGGHARSVADVALATGITNLIFIDEQAKTSETIFGYKVVNTFYPDDFTQAKHIVAIGNAIKRAAIFTELVHLGYTLDNIIAPNAAFGFEARLGQGIFIAHGAHLGPLVSIGDNSIVNTHAVVEHESSIGQNCHIAVNATIAGRCVIGDNVFIGAGATVIDGICICNGAIVGAGAVIVRDITRQGTYVGIPATRTDSISL